MKEKKNKSCDDIYKVIKSFREVEWEIIFRDRKKISWETNSGGRNWVIAPKKSYPPLP